MLAVPYAIQLHGAERSFGGAPPPLPPLRLHWELRGPWRWGQPVHETMTRLTLVRTTNRLGLPAPSAPEVWEYVRGVVWNDDPEGLLFDRRRFKVFGEHTTTRYSTGLAFAVRFQRAKRARRTFTVDEPSLLRRSHFGDLQFLHAMAPHAQPAPLTHTAILRWAEFTHGVATGRIAGTTTIADVPVAGVPELFGPALRHHSVERLFLISPEIRRRRGVDVTKRAAGSLLHLVQDSFATGHVSRTPTGEIEEFHAYEQQDRARHATADRVGSRRLRLTYEARVAAGGPSQAAVVAGDAVLGTVLAGTSWDEARPEIEALFRLATDARAAGPGTQFASG